MLNLKFKTLVPHIIAVAVFVLISLIYCKPALQGKVLQQSDIMHWKGMSKDIQDYRDTHDGVAPLWTINMFSGMPGFQIATNNNNYLSYYAKDFKTPTLVIHGEQDFRDVTGQGMQLFTVLQQQNVPSKLLLFPDEGHWILKPQNSLLWYHTVLDWIGEWTKK